MLIKRLGFYLFGFAIGLVFLAYFLKGKNAEFCYSPNCRVLKNISSKKIDLTPEVQLFFAENEIDSAGIRAILKAGDVLFSKSDPRKKPCPDYSIEGVINDTSVELQIINCDSVARIEKINLLP